MLQNRIIAFNKQDLYKVKSSNFSFQKKKCEYDWLNIQVDIDNVPMNDGTLFHGLHIHQYGEMTNGCKGMGPHYNPGGTLHGAPWQPNR